MTGIAGSAGTAYAAETAGRAVLNAASRGDVVASGAVDPCDWDHEGWRAAECGDAVASAPVDPCDWDHEGWRTAECGDAVASAPVDPSGWDHEGWRGQRLPLAP
ncbi:MULTISPECIES: hypothetical protein [unclassified Streptomyces]|uniref:hypothetical protein n=1 Tax=unclassified Streptomyces TaxID=2593676 RepID=UPI0038148D05